MSEPWWTLARWAIVTAWGVLAVFLGDPLVRRGFHLAGDRVPVPDPAVPATPAPPPGPDADAAPPPEVSLVEAAGARLRGGRAIGWLERLGVYATILAGFPAGIAVVVAVKGLARYPDLKASDGTAERFILGTFTSLLVAAAAAGAAHWCLGLVAAPVE